MPTNARACSPWCLALLCSLALADAPPEAEYYLARWQWHEATVEEPEEYWHAPAGTIGLVDLRPLANQDNWAFFATDGTMLAGDALYLAPADRVTIW